MEQVLADADWLIVKLKFEIASSPVDDLFGWFTSTPAFITVVVMLLSLSFSGQRSPTCTQAKDLCSSLCDRLTPVVELCSELTQTNLVAGPLTEGLLKVCFTHFIRIKQ